MRRLFLALLFLALLPPAAWAEQGPSAGGAPASPISDVRVEILERGLYNTVPGTTRMMPDGLGETIVEAVELERSTTAIPARPGISFGFEFQLHGQPGAELDLTTTVVFPPPGLTPPGATTPVLSSSLPMRVRLGGNGVFYRGYTFDQEWEVAPGPWRFELRAGGRLLAVQNFIITQESRFRR
jgi:Domain of unknown function (DUF3859)